MAREMKNKTADCIRSTAGLVVPIASAYEPKIESEDLKKQNEALRAELEQKEKEISKLQVLHAQMQTDMIAMQKKYAQLEQKYNSAIETNTILVTRCNVMEAELLQLRRKEFGSTSEKTENAGHQGTNTTALPEGTGSGNADENNTEKEMAEGVQAQERDHSTENAAETGGSVQKKKENTGGEKIARPNNIRKQMAEKLPRVNLYPLSPELIRKLDEIYGQGKWKLMNWEPTAHLVHIPEMYINQVDFVPVILTEEGKPARPFAEHPNEFKQYILPHSVLSSSEFANIVHKKFVMGIPLYSQEREFLEMTGIHLGRQCMCDWIITGGIKGFVQVYEYLIRMEQACMYHCIDETFLQVLRDGRAAATKSYLWAHRTGELADPVHPVAVFMFELTRATEHLRKYFPDDIAAIISCDHYISYEVLEKEREMIFTALCWMHVRRRFFFAFDLVANIKDLSEESIRNSLEAKLLQKIGEIYREEMKLRKLTPEERKSGRDQKVRPLVEEFFAILHGINSDDATLTSTLKDAVAYALGGEEKLKRFLDDPRIPIDNGSAERIIRRVAKGRRAWLFCDTENGAKALAVMYSLVTTAQMNGVNDYYYIRYLCEHIPGGIGEPIRKLTDDELEALMPWSDQYKAYERHEIESRYDNIIVGKSLEDMPRDADVQKMRMEMEKQEDTDSSDNNEVDVPLPSALDHAQMSSTEKQGTPLDNDISREDKDAVVPSSDPIKEKSVVETNKPEKKFSSGSGRTIRYACSDKPQGDFPPGTWGEATKRKTG